MENILNNIDDDVLLIQVTEEEDKALYDLYHEYITIQEDNDDYIKLTEDATGKDLKRAVIALPQKEELRLLSIYNQGFVPEVQNTECNEKQYNVIEKIWEDASLRRWLVKTITIFALLVIGSITGTALAIGVMTGKITDNPLINTIMNSGIEIIKLMFGVGI